jgi:hypothetical protein
MRTIDLGPKVYYGEIANASLSTIRDLSMYLQTVNQRSLWRQTIEKLKNVLPRLQLNI